MSSSDSGKYLYNIERLRFRNKASIKLPKSGDANTLNRETCYKIAVDIVIESITKPDFRNFKTTPYHGFYGYATLVMRDCIAPKIQLEFGRNRIFEQRIVEAFDGWNSLAFYLQTTKRFLELLANTLRVGNPPSFLVNLCDIDAFSVAWSEIDLREIYVNCTENTQFRIELSWVSPEKFTDNCGKLQDGKSKEPDDADKDDGLPPDGTQPKKNSPNNPWEKNNPVAPLTSASPYFNPKGNNLNNADPDNSVPPLGGSMDGISYNITVDFGIDYHSANNSVVGSSTGQVYFPVIIGEILSIGVSQPLVIFAGDYIGIVSSQVVIVGKNGTFSGSLSSTNVFPPFGSAFGSSRWSLKGINSFSIVPN